MFEVAKLYEEMQEKINQEVEDILTEKISQFVGQDLSKKQIAKMLNKKKIEVVKYQAPYSKFTYYAVSYKGKDVIFKIKVLPVEDKFGYKIEVEEEL